MLLHLSRGFQEPAALPEKIVTAIDHERLRAFVDREVRERITALARAFAVPAQTVCYECRVAAGDSRVDYAVCLLPGCDRGLEVDFETVRERFAPDPSWATCFEFLRSWLEPDSALLPQVPFVCVAFDLDGVERSLPGPCVSVCVDRAFFERRLGFVASDPPSRAEYEALVVDCHRRLSNSELEGAGLERLRRCLDTADWTEPKHVSFMLSRVPAAFKLDIRVPGERVGEFLSRIAWPGAPARLESRVQELAPSKAVQLNLVLSPEFGRVLEVEFFTRAHEVDESERMALLERLVARGLCSVDKAEALREISRRPLTDHVSGLGVAQNWYAKVRFFGDDVIDAKVYLAHMPRVRRSSRANVGEKALSRATSSERY